MRSFLRLHFEVPISMGLETGIRIDETRRESWINGFKRHAGLARIENDDDNNCGSLAPLKPFNE